MLHFTTDHLKTFERFYRANLINGISGFKPAALIGAFDALRPGATIVQVGLGGEFTIPMNTVVAKEFALKGTFRFNSEFATAVEMMNGGLIDVSFTIRKDAQEAQTVVDLAEVRLNEGQVPLTAVPVAGFDTTDGVITIRRSVVRPFERTLGNRIELVCVAEVSQHVGPMPAPLSPHVTPLLPKLSTSNEKPTWQRHKHSFVGPIADRLFATTGRWLYWR